MAMPMTLRDTEGYLKIDHRESPGLPHPFLGKGTMFEAPTFGCPYCQAVVVINPNRTRDREYCPKLHRYMCDSCGAKRKSGIDLKPFTQIIDEFLTATAHGTVDAFIAKTVKGLTHGT